MAAVTQGRGNAFAAGTLGLLLALHCFTWHASATTWTVGDSGGWSLGVDYTTWASGKTFKTGDVLFFPYTKAEHDVVVVGKSGYDSCSAANPVATFTDGNTNVTLNASGTQYYLCSVVGHCSGGMKLAVTVVAAGGAAPAPAPSTTTKAPPAPAPSTTTKAPPPSVVSSPTPSSSPASTPASVETPASAPTPSPSLASAPASVETPSSAPTPAGPTTPSPSTTPPPSSAPLAPPPSSAPSLPTTAALAAALGLAATLLAL